ncbi:MAG: DsbA family protein [Bryobacteraceae bacterium]
MKSVALLLGLSAFFLQTLPVAAASGKAAGAPSAPILIEVFSDYQCPACKLLHEQTLRPLLNDYVQGGKVYLIHREFPLAMHQYAAQAAAYACAAGRIGKYEQVAGALFARQDTWSVDGKVDEAACSALTPAEAAKVRALVKDAAVAAEVRTDMEMANRARIQQTPTMIITHRLKQYPLSGAVNYELLRRFLDELLAK